MSGHSKWSQIKRSKGKIDSQRGAAFTKVSREIYVAAKLGGADPAGNFRLKTCIEKAKQASMPLENIKKAIQRATSGTNTESFEELQYEGYGAGGVAVIVSSMTDNRNRTAGEIRSYFTKCDGNMGETGCVGWMFSEKGIMTVSDHKGDLINFDDLFMSAAELGADDVVEIDNGIYQVITAPNNNVLESVQKGLDKLGYTTSDVEISMLPNNSVEINDELTAKKVLKLLDLLENNDDVQNVYSNFDIKEDILSLVSN